MQHPFTPSQIVCWAFVLLPFLLSGQSTRKLFSKPGLSIGSYHTNIYDGTWSTSWRFKGDTVLCGDTLLIFESLTNTSQTALLKIQGGKVWRQNPLNPCAAGTLFYDFDLLPGQSFQVPFGPVLQVIIKSQKTLMNGNIRRYLRLTASGWSIEWIEGIGDINNGLFPAFYDFEGFDRFVCARDASGDLWQNQGELSKCDSLQCPTPIPQFSTTVDGKTVYFTNQTQHGVEWIWDFGDGQSSTEQHPVHTYDGPGCYTVCLRAYSNCLQQAFQQCRPTPICISPAWEQRAAPPGLYNTQYISDIEFISPDTGWVLASRSIWKTNNGGQTWTQQIFPEATPPIIRRLQKIQMLNAQTGIIACGHYSGNGNEKAILITHDGGQTWEERADGSYFLSEAILTPDGQGFATGQFKELFYSNDGGDTWNTRDIPGVVELLWMQYMGGDTLYAFGYQGIPPQHTPAFIRSFDSGLNWQVKLMPNDPIQYDAHFFNTQQGWAIGGPGYLLQTTDGGQNWQPRFFGANLQARSIAFVDEFRGWAVGDKGLVLHTTHGGFDWKRENCGYEGNMRNLAVAGPQTAIANGNQTELLAYAPGLLPNCGLSVHNSEVVPTTPNLLLWPNPATSVLNLLLSDNNTLQSGDKIMIFNTLGQVSRQWNWSGDALELEVSGLPPGCYALAIVRANHRIAIRRFIKD